MILVVNRYPLTEEAVVTNGQAAVRCYVAAAIKEDSITYCNVPVEMTRKISHEAYTASETDASIGTDIHMGSTVEEEEANTQVVKAET